MDIERLGISLEQQLEIDAFFLDTTINALNQKVYYRDRAWLMTESPDLPNELETIHARVFDAAHGSNMETKQIGEIPPLIITNLGRLAYIDSLALPSAERVVEWRRSISTLGAERPVLKRKTDVERARQKWSEYRRLFRGLPHTD